jgi:hypothetical protein
MEHDPKKSTHQQAVIAGLDPAISMLWARPRHVHRDGRDKPGHDGSE